MATRARPSIEQRLTEHYVTLSNALNINDIAELLSAYSYDLARIRIGLALHEQALTAQARHRREFGEQQAATAAFDSAWDNADECYMRLVKLTRVALKHRPEAASILGLHGDRKRSLSGWFAQAQQFYDGLATHPEITAKLTAYGITADKLAAARAEYSALRAAYNAQAREHSAAQQATAARDAAFDALDEWMSDFIAIAKIALEDEPQLLEKLGILAHS
ncbi:hypothetical protein F8S13_25345 [Chloroflexia bacterium SDU3-3]|nr:hypothetical protein F8S13_25345 [Chloroflexia bacterium SDU3-3]